MRDELMNGDRGGEAKTARRDRRSFGHIPELDGIRGVAILLVVVHHTRTFLAPSWHWLPRGGFLGVDIFFVLSGFLITGLLVSEHARTARIGFRHFYARRALRLFPALAVLLAIHLVYAYATGLAWQPEKSGVLSVAFYYSNWYAAHTLQFPRDLGALWSLAVEEQFYLVWPPILALLLATRRRTVTVVFLVAAVVIVAVHRAQMWHRGILWLVPYMRTDTRIDGLMIGALAALLWHEGRAMPRRVALFATSAAAFVVVSVYALTSTDGFLYDGGFTLFAICAAIVILACLGGDWAGRRLLRNRALRGFGRISYGLYLWHAVVFSVVLRYAGSWPAIPRIALAYAITAAATLLSWHLVERPFLSLKRRFSLREGTMARPDGGGLGAGVGDRGASGAATAHRAVPVTNPPLHPGTRRPRRKDAESESTRPIQTETNVPTEE